MGTSPRTTSTMPACTTSSGSTPRPSRRTITTRPSTTATRARTASTSSRSTALSDSDYKADVLSDCQTVAEWAEDHNLLAAIGETGISSGIQDETSSYKDWYYDDFGKNFMTDSTSYCTQIVYALAWENANEHSYRVPLPNNELWDGFKKLYESDYAVFADDSDWQTALSDAGYYA